MILDAIRDTLLLSACQEDDVKFLVGVEWCDRGLKAIREGYSSEDKAIIWHMMHLACEKMGSGNEVSIEAYKMIGIWRTRCMALYEYSNTPRTIAGLKHLAKECEL